jgi:hypothetical protein
VTAVLLHIAEYVYNDGGYRIKWIIQVAQQRPPGTPAMPRQYPGHLTHWRAFAKRAELSGFQ